MALWTIKKIQAPLAQLETGTVHCAVTVRDKDSGAEAVYHVSAEELAPGQYDPVSLMQILETDHAVTPNDFGL